MPPFNKPDGIDDGEPTDGDESVSLVLGAVGNVELGAEPGLRTASIAGFSFPGKGVGDGMDAGRGEFTGAEANLDDVTGEPPGNPIGGAPSTGESTGASPGAPSVSCTGAEANLDDVTGEPPGNPIGGAAGTGEFSGVPPPTPDGSGKPDALGAPGSAALPGPPRETGVGDGSGGTDIGDEGPRGTDIGDGDSEGTDIGCEDPGDGDSGGTDIGDGDTGRMVGVGAVLMGGRVPPR
ncbi:hypothetical protein [Streptomyces sp. TLI_185]|uniref:hypothetical protein n=1 Tax=Streptomyces sp. TLI_185 TaxID=2485151 RepID=UPI000F4E11A2|nr:hypothetical protein [Streptomyces sp. TLI_185]